MRSLELAGVIDTWAAAALALIALIGVIPIYMGYRRKVKTWANEIARVDDPNRDFVTRGWPGILGQRYFSRFHAPNLFIPAEIYYGKIKRTSRPEYWPQSSQSRTGWINFLNILRSYDVLPTDPNPDRKPKMIDGELMPPVHRSWILLLCLVDRYSRRQDHGLLSGESGDPQVRLRFGSRALSGLSSVLSPVIADQNKERGSEQDIICFHMHGLGQIYRLSSEATDGEYSLQRLLFLFLGYIPASDGHLYLAELPSKMDKYHSKAQDEREIWEFREVERCAFVQRHRELSKEMRMGFPKVLMLQRRKPNEDEEKLFFGHATEYYDLYPGTTGAVLIRRTHANAVLRAAMDLGCSPQSFIYARNKDGPGLMFSVLGRKGLNGSIKRAQEALDGDDQRHLQPAMEEILNTLSEYRQPSLWSRGLWAKLSNLHTTIVGSFSEAERPHVLAIGVLFTFDNGFRKLLKSFDTKTVSERRQNSLTLDFPAKAIGFPAPDGTGDQSFAFNFAEFF